jgi:hypothetical protein
MLCLGTAVTRLSMTKVLQHVLVIKCVPCEGSGGMPHPYFLRLCPAS